MCTICFRRIYATVPIDFILPPTTISAIPKGYYKYLGFLPFFYSSWHVYLINYVHTICTKNIRILVIDSYVFCKNVYFKLN